MDHIPPKALFAKNNRDGLVLVPSCENCNSGASKDDEYFRDMLAMRESSAASPDAVEAVEAMLRGLATPQKKSTLDALYANIKEVEYWRSGLYLGLRPAYDVDLSRLERVVERITKGLNWQETREHLPAARYSVVSRSVDGIPLHLRQELIGTDRLVDIALSDGIYDVGGRKVFQFSRKRAVDDPIQSFWVLRFYENVYFFVFIISST